MLPWRRLILVACLAATACAPVEDGPPPAESVPTTSSTVGSTTTVVDVAGLCNGYLVLLRSGDPEPLRSQLDDPELVADLETMLSSEGEFDAIAAAALRLEEAVVGQCADRFALSVEPAPDDAAALSQFLGAVTAGDEASATEVAWENVVAQFTWSGTPESEIHLEGNTASMRMGPTRIVNCEATGGVVVACRFSEG